MAIVRVYMIVALVMNVIVATNVMIGVINVAVTHVKYVQNVVKYLTVVSVKQMKVIGTLKPVAKTDYINSPDDAVGFFQSLSDLLAKYNTDAYIAVVG